VSLRPVLLRARVGPGQPLPQPAGAAAAGAAADGDAGAAHKAASAKAKPPPPAAAAHHPKRAHAADAGGGGDEYTAQPHAFWGQMHYEHEHKPATGETVVRLVGQPDEFVYDAFFKHPVRRGGIFVELGAVDGIKYSNTRFFEDTLDWSGLLIEGSKENFLSLYHNRPRSAKAWSSICDAVGTQLFVGDGAAAGAVDSLTEKHLLSFGKFFKSMDPYEVPCEPLSDILARSGVTHIDLFSVDMSGAEAIALRTFDWAAVSVDVLILNPGPSCFVDGKNECEEMLLAAGMCRAAKLAVNEYWVGTRELKGRFCVDATPPPVKDVAAAGPKKGAKKGSD